MERTDVTFGENVTLRPTRPGAEPASWLDLGADLQFNVGIHSRWELDRTPSDVAYIDLLCDAVIAGRGYEVSAPNRSRVVLRDASGRIHRETGYEGCLLVPLPFWTRWGRRHDFLSYREA